MAKQFLKRMFMAIFLTMLIVIVASLTYQYVVPMVLSMDTSRVSEVNTGEGMLHNAKEQVMNFMGQNEEKSQDTQLWYQNNTVEKSQGTQTDTASHDAIPYGTALGGKVTRIVDGDTLDIDGTRIRLALVNTPEIGEAGYAKATAFTRANCPVGSTAMYDTDDSQKDGSYGRIIGKVWCFGYPVVTPETSLNAMLIDAGHAKVLSGFCNTSEFSSNDWAKPYC